MRSSLKGTAGEASGWANEDFRETGLEGTGDMGWRFGEDGVRPGAAGFCRIRRRPVECSGPNIGDLLRCKEVSHGYESNQLSTCQSLLPNAHFLFHGVHETTCDNASACENAPGEIIIRITPTTGINRQPGS